MGHNGEILAQEERDGGRCFGAGASCSVACV